jgi:exodeoxyribonuclease VII small subunit
MNYASALKELEEIVQKLQGEGIGIDDLSEKVKRASELIAFCREKLRITESDTQDLLE